MLKEKYREMVKGFREMIESSDSGYGDLLLFLILLLGLITLSGPSIPADTYPYIRKVIVDESFSIIVLLYTLTGFMLGWFYLGQSLPLARRAFFLFIAVILGLLSFFNFDIRDIDERLQYLMLVIPTFFILWVFRTYDIQRQIDKNQESINNSSFFECARMLTTEDSLAKKMVLEQLAYLRRETGFDKKRTANSSSTASAKHQYVVALEQLAYLRRETGFDKKRIDLLTRGLSLKNKNFRLADLQNIDLFRSELENAILIEAKLEKVNLHSADLNHAYLTYADLNHVNLSHANLSNTKLIGTNLSNADLRFATLTSADLKYADLRGADLGSAELKGTNFNGTKHLDKASLFLAIYDNKTNFQGTHFENKEARDKAMMKYEPD